MQQLSMILAASLNNVIGRDGALPWHLRADLQRFKRLTTGHVIVMGRRTFESIGRLLPGRTSIVITRNRQWQPDLPDASDHQRFLVFGTWEQTLQFLRSRPETTPFVIGGAQLFSAAINDMTHFYLTRVLAEVPGDVMLPPVSWDQWERVRREEFAADDHNDFAYAFEDYQRKLIPLE